MAKKIIDERKITKALNKKAQGYAVVGLLEGDYAYLTNGAFAMMVSMDQIKKDGRLWKMVMSAVEFAGGRNLLVRENSDGSRKVVEQTEPFFKIFECKPEQIMAAEHTGTEEKGGKVLDLVRLENDKVGGFDADLIAVIKEHRAMREGSFTGQLGPLHFAAHDDKTGEMLVKYVVLPVRM